MIQFFLSPKVGTTESPKDFVLLVKFNLPDFPTFLTCGLFYSDRKLFTGLVNAATVAL